MRKIVAGLFVTLDGVVEAPERWQFPYFNDEVQQVIGARMAGSDTMLLGRRTYEEFAAYWPSKAGEGDPVADHMNNTPKLVVSTTLNTVEWENSTLIQGDVTEQLAKHKEQHGKDISVVGSAKLVRSLLRANLLDELGLMVHPIVVGKGKRLFEDGADIRLELLDSRTLATGVLSLTYAPAR
jgi:dihydrofolate reductase